MPGGALRVGGGCRLGLWAGCAGVALPGRILRPGAAQRFFLKRWKVLVPAEISGRSDLGRSFFLPSFLYFGGFVRLRDVAWIRGFFRILLNCVGGRIVLRQKENRRGGRCGGSGQGLEVCLRGKRDVILFCGAFGVKGAGRRRIRLCGFCGPARRFCRTVLPGVGAGRGVLCGILPRRGNFPLLPEPSGCAGRGEDDGFMAGRTTALWLGLRRSAAVLPVWEAGYSIRSMVAVSWISSARLQPFSKPGRALPQKAQYQPGWYWGASAELSHQ